MARKAQHVDDLLEEAKAGQRKLTTGERRRVLIYMDEIGEIKHSAVELAKLFQVNEKTIRADRQRILTDVSAQLTPEAQMMIVANHMRDLEHLIVTAKLGLEANERGTINERFYIETLNKLYKERRETYENVGVIRKELGTLNVAEEHWVAEANTDSGILSVRQATQDEAEADRLQQQQ